MIRVLTNRVTTNINIFILSVLLIPFATVLPGTAMGQSVINVDFEAGVPGDTTHVGADGVLSNPGGTVWNSVYPNQAANDLPDESWAPTGVDIVFTSTSAGVLTDPYGIYNNFLQDSGIQGSFRIDGLIGGRPYDVAFYSSPYSNVRVRSATGVWEEVVCSFSLYLPEGLPGKEGWDYCLFEDLLPYEEGYLEIESSGAGFGSEAIAGLQVRGDLVAPECFFDTDCDDDVDCTDDVCDTSQACQHDPNDGLCDNGVWCDGIEVCDPTADCQAGTEPCGDNLCLEDLQECSDVECNVPSDCPPGQTCSEDGNCVDAECSVDADCDDGVDCTEDVCASQMCQHDANDSLCDNGFWCDGIEVCDSNLDCRAGPEPCAADPFCLEYSDECSDVECLVGYDCVIGKTCSEDAECVDIPSFNLEDADPDASFYTLVEGQDTGLWITYASGLGDLAARQAFLYFPDGFDLNDPGPPGTVVGDVCIDANEDGIDEICYYILVMNTSPAGSGFTLYVDIDGSTDYNYSEPAITVTSGCIILNIVVPYGGSKDTLTVPLGLRTRIEINPGLITPTEPGSHVLKLIVLSVDPDTGDSDDGMHNPPVEVTFEYPVEVLADTDGDGVADAEDQCPEDPNKVMPGICGCGVADSDSDSDGVLDCEDACPDDSAKSVPGICGCGVPDTDTDGDDVADCEDACPNDPEKTAPGACGCGELDTDSDGDGSPQCLDCDDGDGSIRPGAEELCNDVDDDCDGVVDEGCECGPNAIPADLDSDCDVDWHDVLIILRHCFRPASVCPDCDLNGDGWITLRDVKKCIFMCTRPWCACD